MLSKIKSTFPVRVNGALKIITEMIFGTERGRNLFNPPTLVIQSFSVTYSWVIFEWLYKQPLDTRPLIITRSSWPPPTHFLYIIRDPLRLMVLLRFSQRYKLHLQFKRTNYHSICYVRFRNQEIFYNIHAARPRKIFGPLLEFRAKSIRLIGV